MALQMTIPDMACSACSDTITSAIQKIDAAATIQTDLKTKQVVVETQAAESVIKQAITSAGYTVA
jgi:copper chaperone